MGAWTTKRAVMRAKPTGSTTAASCTGMKAMRLAGSKPMSTSESELQVMAAATAVEMKEVAVPIHRRHGWPNRSTPAERVMCLFSREVMAPPRQVSQSTRWWVRSEELGKPVRKSQRAKISTVGSTAMATSTTLLTPFSRCHCQPGRAGWASAAMALAVLFQVALASR